jgi:DNA-binding beta-propeller fold protein YncE
MFISNHPSKKAAYLAILAFFLFLANTSFSETLTGAQQKPEELIKEGIDLYNSGQYEKAITTLNQVEGLKPNKRLLSEAYFYLSLCYFQLGDKENTKQFIGKTIQVEPEKKIDETKYAPEYVELFKQAQSEVPTVATREARPGGGIKIGRIALVGAVVVAVGAAAYFLFIREDTGDIQVSSTPTAAQVFLDGADTGWKTNCTLTKISPGDHIMKLVKDGYTDYEQKVSVKRGKTSTLNLTLSTIPIRVTKPAAGSSWIKGQIMEIKWETGTSASLSFLQRTGQFRDFANDSSYLRRMSAFQTRSAFQRESGKSRMDSEGSGSGSALALKKGFISSEREGENPVSSSVGKDSGRPDLSLRSQDIRAQSLYERKGSSSSQASEATQPGQSSGRTGVAQKANLLDIAKVKIELYKGADAVETIESSTENDGSQNWTVPTTLAEKTDYKIRVSCASDPKIYGESGNFSVTAANIAITEPTSGAIWGKGESKTIKWTSTVSGAVRIDLLKGIVPYFPIIDNTANNGSFTWTISSDLEDRADFRIRITHLSDASVKGESPAFIIAKITYDVDAVMTGLTSPIGITIDQAGNAHVAEGDLNRVQKFTPASGPISPIIAPYGSGLNQPRGIVADTMGGFIYVADSGNHRVRKFDANGTLLATIGGPLPGSNDGEFNSPHGVAVDIYGNLYVTDRNNKRVQKFSLSLTWLQSWSVSADPVGIACDSARTSLYVADYDSKQVLVYDMNGTFYRSFSVAGRPLGIAVDKSGFIFVTDVENHSILKYSPDGVLLFQKGSYGDGYDQFKVPAGICFDSFGRMLVTSFEGNRVQRFK